MKHHCLVPVLLFLVPLSTRTFAGDMRGQAVCGVPPTEAVAYTFQERRSALHSFIGTGGSALACLGHRHTTEQAAVAAHEPEAEYVCEVEILDDLLQTVPARFYRLHRPQRVRHQDPVTLDIIEGEFDPRQAVVGVSEGPTGGDLGPTGYCGIPLSEATVVLVDETVHYRTYGPLHLNNNIAFKDDLGFAIYTAVWSLAGPPDGFPSFHQRFLRPDPASGREYFLPRLEDADCQVNVRGVNRGQSVVWPIWIYRIGAPLSPGQQEAQNAFYEDYKEFLIDEPPWSGGRRNE